MKFAILSDVHANAEALKIVLQDAKEQGAEKILCLGDVVGYGPDAGEAVRLCQESCDVVLMGNHDAAVAGVIPCGNFRAEAQMGVFRHRHELSAEDRDWLGSRPYTCRTKSFVCAHGSPFYPEAFNYVMDEMDAGDAIFAAEGKRLIFVGHTHFSTCWRYDPGKTLSEVEAVDCVLEPKIRLVVNVGSVGYPRAEPESVYVLYDTKTHQIVYRRLPFDFRGYVKRMDEKGVQLPDWLEEQWRPFL